MGNPNYASPTDLSEGGGLYDQCWVKVIKSRTEITSKFSKPTPVWALTLQEVESGQQHEELFMAGSADNWDVDGKWFIPKTSFHGKPAKLSKNNAVGEILDNLEKAGFKWNDQTFPETGGTQIDGHFLWVERYDLTDRDGKVLTNDKGYAKTAVMFTRWGGNGAQPVEQTGASAAQPAAQATAAAPAASIDEGALTNAILAQLANGPVALQALTTAIATAPPAGMDVGTLFQNHLAPNSAWMSDAARPWTVNAGMVTKK